MNSGDEKLLFYKRRDGVELHIIYTGNEYTSFGVKTGEFIISLSNSEQPIRLTLEEVSYLTTVLELCIKEATVELQAAHQMLMNSTKNEEKDDRTDRYIK